MKENKELSRGQPRLQRHVYLLELSETIKSLVRDEIMRNQSLFAIRETSDSFSDCIAC